MNLCIAHGGDMGEPSGGTDRVSAFASGLADSGVAVSLVIPEPSGALPVRLAGVDVETVRPTLDRPIARAVAVARRAKAVANRRNAVLQIEHSSLAGIATLVGVDDFVLDMHDLAYSRFDHLSGLLTPAMRATVKRLEARAISEANHVIVVSENMREVLREEWGVAGDDISVIPNGYFPEAIEGISADLTPGRVAFFGTLHPKVDCETIGLTADLEAVSEVVVIGDGAQRRRLEGIAAETDAVRLTGRLPDREAFELLSGAVVLINPQSTSAIQRTSSPVKLFYYAALGKPMVVTAGPSIVATLVRHTAAATACSSTGFVRNVRAVLGDRSLAEELSDNATEVASEFRWSKRVESLEGSYSSISGSA